jgi:ABC-type uncharacterized transport system substrate-binding protein
MLLLGARRTPAIGAFQEFVEGGALLSCGIDLDGLWRDTPECVDRITKKRPADLPITQPTHFVMVIDLKMARASEYYFLFRSSLAPVERAPPVAYGSRAAV